MHKKFFILFGIVVSTLNFISCSPTISKVWLFEWQFLNAVDSTTITGNYSYCVTVDQIENAANVTHDSLFENGVFIFQIITVGDENYIKEFPLTAKINLTLEFNKLTVIDTSVTMNSLKFSSGYSKLYKQETQNINYDTLFVFDSVSN